MTTADSASTTTPHDPIALRIDYTDGAPLRPDDPRAAMARSIQAVRAVLAEGASSGARR